MAQEPRGDTSLSTHSSLEDEEIDLEKEKRRKRLATKTRFPGAAYATQVVPKQERDDPPLEEGGHFRSPQKKNLAVALAILGGVAVAGASWTPRKKTKQKEKLKGAAATVSTVHKVARNDQYTIAHALRKAAGVAIAAGSWAPKKRTMKGVAKAGHTMAKAKKVYGRLKEYNIAEGLRIAGGVAIAGTSWTKQKSEEEAVPVKTTTPLELLLPLDTKPTFVDTATSPIIISLESMPPSRHLTPTAVVIATKGTPPTPVPSVSPTPPPSVPAHSVDPLTPVIFVQPAREIENTPIPVVEEDLTPTPIVVASPTPTPAVVTSPTPTPAVVTSPTPTPAVVASPTPAPVVADPAPTPARQTAAPPVVKVVEKEVHREVVHSRRGSRHGVELLAAAAIINRQHNPAPAQPPPPKVATPPPKVATPPPKVATPPPKVATPPPTVAASSPAAEKAVAPSPIVREQSPSPEPTIIALPEEKPVTIANAAAGNKPKKETRKPLAKLTPLEQLTAKARSLR